MALRTLLPARARHHPALPRYLPRVGVIEASLPDGRILRMSSHGDDDGVASSLFWRDWAGYEPETARSFYEAAASARVTLDIGAHVGYFALLASHANPNCRVHAFEPFPRTMERLLQNIRLNGASNVVRHSLAVGSSTGTAEFFHVKPGRMIPSSSSLSRRFMRSIVSDEQLTSSEVAVIRLDDFVEANGLVVDLVKIDTETTEDHVLQGMGRTLARDRPVIICEVLDEATAIAIEGLLRPLEYDFYLLTAEGEIQQAHVRPDPRWHNFAFRPRVQA